MALDNAPVCLFRWKFRSKLWRWRNVLFATERIDPWATLANTAFLNSLNREALVRAAPSKNQVCMLLLVSFPVIISVITQRFSPTGKKCLCDLHNNSCKRDYTHYSKMAAIMVLCCCFSNYPLLSWLYTCNSKENFPLNKATRAYLQANERTLKWWPFWNNVCYHW